jgi:hypothetical protein
MTAALTIDSLLALGRSGDSHQFINLATAVLAQGVNHDGLRLLLVQRLAECGLLHRAIATAEGLSDGLRNRPDVADMVKALGGVGDDGRTPWSRLAGRFDANLEALGQRYAWADQVQVAWNEARSRLELHVTKDGAPQVFDRVNSESRHSCRGQDPGIKPGTNPGMNPGAQESHPEPRHSCRDSGMWRPAFGNHFPQPPAEQLAARFRNQVLTPFVIDGVGLGHHLPWLYSATTNTFLGASPRIYQIECSLVALAVALHLNDWRQMLADERVRLCCGTDAYEQFERAVSADQWGTPPRMTVQAPPWDVQNLGRAQNCVEKLTGEHESRRVALRESVRAAYAGRDRRWWHRRFSEAIERVSTAPSGTGTPLRVLGITSRFTTVLQYSMRDALNALQANGCQTRLLIEPDDHALVTPARKLEVLREFQPDLVFLIDHTRQGQRAGLVDEVPVVTWVQDRLPWLFNSAAGQAMGPLDFCMGIGQRELVRDHGYPAERFYACEMATDPSAMLPTPASPPPALQSPGFQAGVPASRPIDRPDDRPEVGPTSDDTELLCDVAYATSHSQSPAEFHANFRQRCDEPLRRLVDLCYEELLALNRRSELNGGLWPDRFLWLKEQSLGIELSAEQRANLAAEYVRLLADRLIRHQTVEWTADWADATGARFHLYGNGWESQPRYAKYARGFLRHGPLLGRAFRAAGVNLHAGCNPALHQRVLDGLAAGGFFLVRRHAHDISHRTWSAIYELVRQNRLHVGQSYVPADLPPPLDQEHALILRMSGYDPAIPATLTAEYLETLKSIYESQSTTIAGKLWPQFDRVTFGTQSELAERLEYFRTHADERQAIAAAMRAGVLETFTYQGLTRRLLLWLAQKLADPSAEPQDSCPPVCADAGAAAPALQGDPAGHRY